MTVDLCSLIDRNAAFAPDKTAIAFEGERLSYAAFAARIEQTATAMKQELGVGRGEAVELHGVSVCQMDGDLIREERVYWDTATLLAGAGLLG